MVAAPVYSASDALAGAGGGGDREPGGGGERRCLRSGHRGAQLRQDDRAGGDLQLARGPAAAAPGRPRERARLAPGPAGRPRAQLLGQHLRQRRGRLRRRRPRFYDWGAKGYGIVEPVLFTARNGATLSGHVWATKAGPAKRPGVVITNGSVQAARAALLVRRADARQGRLRRADLRPPGPGPVRHLGEGAGRERGRALPDRGRPFYDGTEDALDFFLSTPGAAVRAAPELQTRHEPRAQAGPPRRRPA